MVVTNLCKSYGEKQVLKDLSLTLESGKFYVLTGASGRGKTTLMHILLGLVPPDSGQMPADIRYSAVFQENRLLPRRSAVENLRPVCRKLGREELRNLLAEILPADCLDAPVETLSGGMQRRVAIARAMAAQSDVIVMDEPFTGLDVQTAGVVLYFVFRHQQGRTLVIATHQLEFVQDYAPQYIHLP